MNREIDWPGLVRSFLSVWDDSGASDSVPSAVNVLRQAVQMANQRPISVPIDAHERALWIRVVRAAYNGHSRNFDDGLAELRQRGIDVDQLDKSVAPIDPDSGRREVVATAGEDAARVARNGDVAVIVDSSGSPMMTVSAPIDPDSGTREIWHRDQAVVVRTEPRLDVETAKKAAKQTEERLRQRRIERDISTPDRAQFWATAERTAQEVETWPDHKRAGINVGDLREEPRSTSCPEKPDNSATLPRVGPLVQRHSIWGVFDERGAQIAQLWETSDGWWWTANRPYDAPAEGNNEPSTQAAFDAMKAVLATWSDVSALVMPEM